MLAIRRGASLVFRAHDPLDRCEIQLSERIVLIPEKTLSTSAVLDRIDPYVHHLAAYERLDPLEPSWANSRSPSMLCGPSSTLNCVSDIGNAPLSDAYSHRRSVRLRLPHCAFSLSDRGIGRNRRSTKCHRYDRTKWTHPNAARLTAFENVV